VCGILKWFMMVADRLGVGLKRLLLVITMPIWRGWTPVLFSRSRMAEKQVTSNSLRA